MTTAEYNKRNQKLDSYLLNNPDVLAAARRFAENAGISEASGIENYNNAQRNFAVQHITTVAIPNQETREGLDQFASDPSGRNTALSVIGAVSPNQGSYDYSNVAMDGSRFEHYQGAVGVDTDPNVPTEGSFTLPGSSPSTGEGDTVSEPPPGDTGGGSYGPIPLIPADIDFSPVTNLIGTDAGPGGEGDRTTLMGRQKVMQDFLRGGQRNIEDLIGTDAGPGGEGDRTTVMGRQKIMQDFLRGGQKDIEDIVTPLGEQVTGLETSIGTAGDVDQFGQPLRPVGATRPDASTLMGRQDIIATDLGGLARTVGRPSMTVAGDDLPATGLFAGQAGLQTGQAGLQTGQEQLGTQIGALGTAAVTDPDTGEVTQKPTGLFAGQAGLMAGQTGLGTQISGIGRDLTADIQAETSRLGSQLGRFQSGVEQYQRGATTARGDIQGTQRAGQANLLQQIQGVGQQANRTAEMMAQQRRFNQNLNNRRNQFNQQQQQAAQFARSAPRATPSNQQVGPMGPMASDPRDVLIQNLLRNASLMNKRPV